MRGRDTYPTVPTLDSVLLFVPSHCSLTAVGISHLSNPENRTVLRAHVVLSPNFLCLRLSRYLPNFLEVSRSFRDESV